MAAQSSSTVIREHNLKRFFGELPARVDVDASHSYAQGASTQELLDLEPGSQERFLQQSLAHYTEDFGRGRLAKAIAAQYKGIAPEDVFVLSGVDAVIFDCFAALAGPGTKAVIQSPGYPPLRNVAEWRGANVVDWKPDANRTWNLASTEDADVVVCCIPHSPFATSPTEEWLRTLCGRCEVQGQTLIVDEIYRGIDLTEDESGVLPSACEISSTAVVFGGLAKTYGLPGLRVGWFICRDPATRSQIETLSLNTNCNTCVPTELLATIAIDHTSELLSKFSSIARTSLAAVDAFVQRSEGLFSWQRPIAGLVVWLDYHGPGSARELAQSVLEREYVMVADHTLFGLEDTPRGGGLRLGLGAEDTPHRLAQLEVAVKRFVLEKQAAEDQLERNV